MFNIFKNTIWFGSIKIFTKLTHTDLCFSKFKSTILHSFMIILFLHNIQKKNDLHTIVLRLLGCWSRIGTFRHILAIYIRCRYVFSVLCCFFVLFIFLAFSCVSRECKCEWSLKLLFPKTTIDKMKDNDFKWSFKLLTTYWYMIYWTINPRKSLSGTWRSKNLQQHIDNNKNHHRHQSFRQHQIASLKNVFFVWTCGHVFKFEEYRRKPKTEEWY